VKPERRLIAHVRCADPPRGITLAEWHCWRKAEDERMARELAEQRSAILELLSGTVTVH
jgi:hypothetical protein